jgi:xanthine dehydrogenase YagS FAD-binding subunit
VSFPRTIDEAVGETGEIRAGSTDLQERRRAGVAPGPLLDLRDIHGLDRIEWIEGAARIGALVRIATVADDDLIRARYPALAEAAGMLATPQIRAVGTMGGSLLQRTRCWYYRQAAFDCHKKGGDHCPAREGNHHYGVCFDRGPCVWPHPSTLGMALLTYEAEVDIHGRDSLSIAALFGDGSDPSCDHQLAPGEVLTHIRLPTPLENERAGYFRAISRHLAEWPLVEVSVRLALEAGRISFARVAVGGVANIPLRLPAVEEQLTGAEPGPKSFERAAARSVDGAAPLPMTQYKLTLLPASMEKTLHLAIGESVKGAEPPSPRHAGIESGLPWTRSESGAT